MGFPLPFGLSGVLHLSALAWTMVFNVHGAFVAVRRAFIATGASMDAFFDAKGCWNIPCGGGVIIPLPFIDGLMERSVLGRDVNPRRLACARDVSHCAPFSAWVRIGVLSASCRK